MRRINGGSARRQGSVYALENLEGRTLLSLVKPLSGLAAEIHAESFSATSKVLTTLTGKITGHTAPDALFTSAALGFHGYAGHGSSTTGTVFLAFQHVASTSTTSSGLVLTNGSGVLTTFYGENIDLIYTGSTASTRANTGVINLTGTVSGGTGQFDGETGTFTATGNAYPSGRFALSFAIYLNPRTA
jgi:hypothetical protein